MAGKYVVRLTDGERERLRGLVGAGVGSARELTHARILLKADSGDGGPAWGDGAISEALDTSPATVLRVRRRYVGEGLGAALSRKKPDREYPTKIVGECEARLIAVACGEAPEGRKGWTLRLLAEKLVELGLVDAVSHETVRKVMKKTGSSRG
jgi:hypothetical protein